MKYALVLESDAQTCNATSALLASMGYLITPVFSAKKALHAAHMIQFDLILTCTTHIPGDRRSLAGELARCSPDAALILLTDPNARGAGGRSDEVNAILSRPFTVQDLHTVIESERSGSAAQGPPPGQRRERRKRAVE